MKILIFLLLLISFVSCQVSNTTPEWIIQKFFGPNDFVDSSKYYCCEMTEHYKDTPHLGFYLPSNISISYRLLENSDSVAIYSVTLKDSTRSEDWYSYFRKIDSDWKLQAVRKLWFPAMFNIVFDSLKYAKEIPDTLQNLYDQLYFYNCSDSSLKQYLIKNINQFNVLKDLFNGLNNVNYISRDSSFSPDNLNSGLVPSIVNELKVLKITSINKNDDFEGVTFFTLGGMLDNEVGFLYSTKKGNVPRMSPENFIYVEKIIGNWYIYKTT